MQPTVSFKNQPREADEWLRRTQSTTGREYRLVQRVERITVQTGPYDNSDLIEIEYDSELKEYRVYHCGVERECVLSVIEEQP